MEYTIQKNGKTFNATDEQKKIFEYLTKGVGNAVIVAAAGSAKTSTIENAIRYLPTSSKILFVAFNKDVCEEIKNDIGNNFKNANISTFHGLGFSILRACTTNKLEIYIHKYKKYITDNIDNITKYKETSSLGVHRSRYLSNIIQLIEYARYNCVMKPKDILKLIDIYSDIVIVRDEAEVVYKALIWGKNNLDCIDYTDMTWLPNELNCVTKAISYSYIFIDEAQDVTIAEERLIERVKGRGCRVIAVGDEKQRINVWCGASAEAFGHFRDAKNTEVFSLSTSFRLPKVGEELIHKEFPDIEIHSAPNAIEGKINYDVNISMVRPHSMVLCRNTTPMIKTMLKVMRMNKKCYLKGWETEQQVFQTIVKDHYGKLLDKNCLLSDGLFSNLYRDLFQRIDKLKENGLTEDEALGNNDVFNFLDQILCLEVISEGLVTTDELIEKLNMIFKSTSDIKDSIIFATVHKSKGLEAEHIFILHPSLIPSPFAIAEWEIEAENNLKYVAYTRFKQTLNFVEEKEYENNFFLFDKKNILSDLKNKKNILQEKKLESDSVTSNNSVTNVAYDIYKNVIIETKTTKTKVKGGIKFGNLLEND